MSSSSDAAQTPVFIYNKFFHPNICHVCKMSFQRPLTCADCSMIYYCCEEHRQMHFEEHKEICKAIQETSKARNIWNTRRISKADWITHKLQNLLAIGQQLRRKLKPYEEQMFLFAKACHVCQQQSDLCVACLECNSVNACEDHRSAHIEHECEQLKISLWLDKESILDTSLDTRIPPNELPDFMVGRNVDTSTEFFVRWCKGDGANDYIWTFEDYKYSEAVSGPLSLLSIILHADIMHLIRSKKSFYIHIVDGCSTDARSLSAWEIVLHALGEGTRVVIAMVEADMKTTCVASWNVCNMCRDSGKSLHFESYSMSYESYMRNELYVRPDIIVGFQIHFDRWAEETIRTLLNQKCPLLFTCERRNRVMDNIKAINEVLRASPTPRVHVENSFRSHRPYRDIEGDTCFHNNYLVFYQALY